VRVWLLAVLILWAPIGPAQAASDPKHRHSPLRAYMAKVVPQIKSYMALARRASEVFDQDPEEIGSFVAGLSTISVRFDRLALRWSAIKAPPGLGLRHRGMGGAFRLQARFFSATADAWTEFDQSQDANALQARLDEERGLLRSAAYLQRRWARAFEGALIRAAIPVPRWLDRMATLQLP
jgi:hypothetical protein